MAISVFPSASGGGAGGFYYNITAAGTYTVNLAAGLYDVRSTDAVTVGGVAVDGNAGLLNYPSGVASLIALAQRDLDDWTTRTSGFGTDAIYGVTHGNGLYVAVGYSGTLTTSLAFIETGLSLEPKSPTINLP